MRFSIAKALLLAFIVVIATETAPAQQSAAPDAREIVNRAAEEREKYLEVFRNLISRETKSFEIFDKKGGVKKAKTVQSTFLVYPLGRDEGRVAEFRNVLAVDGRPVDDVQKRAENFFEKVAAAETSRGELERIENESQRFDPGILISGLTLFQAVALEESLRPYFDFSLKGVDRVDGRAVHVIAFRQVRSSPYIYANSRNRPAAAGFTVYFESGLETDDDLNARLSGEIGIDAETFQIRRERRAMHLQPPGFAQPVLLAETTFDYDDSEFRILTPRKIIHTQYDILRGDKTSRKAESVAFSYEKFTRPDVEVKNSEVGKPSQ